MTEEAKEVEQESQQTESNPIEDKARGMGWTSKEEFKGDPDKWRSAEEFVERGENYIPILKSTVEKQNKQIADLNEKLLDIGMKFSKVEKRAYEKAIAEIEARQEQAVETGDKELFSQTKAELKALEKEISTPEPEKKTEEINDPVFDEWVERNKWFKSDEKLHGSANKMAEFLRATGTQLEGKAFLDEVTKRMKAEFPEKFENPKRNAPSPVEGGNPGSKKGGSKFADLPADIRKDFEDKLAPYIKDKESYAKRYFDSIEKEKNRA